MSLVVLRYCWLWAWLLKYKIYEILYHKERKVDAANAYNANIFRTYRSVENSSVKIQWNYSIEYKV